MILSSLTIWALSQRSKAISQKIIAEKQKDEAISAKQEALQSKKEAEIARGEAIKQRIMADSSAKIAMVEKYKADNARQIAENELYNSIKNTLAISSELVNVIYLGIPNPLQIAVSGIPSERLSVKTDNGTVLKGKLKNVYGQNYIGEYFVTPNKVGEATITVEGEIKKGKMETIGSKIFRVKGIPIPRVVFANKNGGLISRYEALAQDSVLVELPNFDMDLRYTVASFTLEINHNGIAESRKSKNALITDEQKDLLRKLVKGDYIKIESVFAMGPDKRQILLFPITFQIQ